MPYRLIPDQIPRKCQSPLVIPCKFSAVTYSERHSATHSVARRVLLKSLGNKDLHLPGVTGPECQRAGTASVIPLVIGSIPIRQARCRRHCRARAFPRQSSPDAVCCKGVRFGARVIRDTTRHQPSRGKHDSWAPVHRHRARRTVRSWKFSCGAPMSSTKCRSAVAPALQAAPPLLASLGSQIVPRQRVSPAPMAWDILALDSAAINIKSGRHVGYLSRALDGRASGEVDDRCTVSTNHAPAITQLVRANASNWIPSRHSQTASRPVSRQVYSYRSGSHVSSCLSRA